MPAAVGAAASKLDALTAMIKLRGSTDGRLCFVWMKLVRRASNGRRTEPMCGVLHCSLARYTPQAADAWRFDLYELSFYTDLSTGQYRPRLRMPFTGKEVDVPLYRTGPGKHIVKLRNREVMSWSKANTTSEQAARALAPDGAIVYEVETGEPTIQGNTLFVSTTATTELTPRDPSERAWRYEEYFTYSGPLDEIMDPARASVASTVAVTLTMDWRPWMGMGNAPGFTLDHGFGGRVWRAEDLPSDILEHVQRHQPDVLEDPSRWLPRVS